MNHRIHIFGASGSGTSTLGCALSQHIGCIHLDTDSYFWQESDPPYTTKRNPKDRLSMILHDIEFSESWVLSGSICNWGDSLIDYFSFAVFLHIDSTVRMDRLRDREHRRFGSRVQVDGDMYKNHLKFLEWAKRYDTAKAPSRSLDLHNQWMKRLKCPLIELDSSNTIADLCDQIYEQIDA